MKKFWSKPFNRYGLIRLIGVLVASFYPLYMGVRVISEMVLNGTVLKENYPKYIIPYTPISIALIICVLLLPLLVKLFKKKAFWVAIVVAVMLFFGVEVLFENKVVVNSWEIKEVETMPQYGQVLLKDWQMYMCISPIIKPIPEGAPIPEGVTVLKPGIIEKEAVLHTQSVADILAGNYTPAFKMHFYLISVLLIITVLNCIYGFGQMINSGDKKRKVSLILQSVCTGIFLGLCILACFTAFWRDGSLQVSALSAFLMGLFFILMGITAGIFAGSFLLGKKRLLSVWVPAITSSAVTLLMYVGEMILLGGRLYRLGSGWMFDPLPAIVLAPMDILIILLGGGAVALLLGLIKRNRDKSTELDALAQAEATVEAGS